MIYEIEVFLNNHSDKTEKITVEGSGFIIVDSVDGALFCVTTASGSPNLVLPVVRVKQMKKLIGSRRRKLDKPKEVKSVAIR